MKYQSLFLFATASIIYTVIFSSQKVLSQVCPFDSYVVIEGKCHNITERKSQPILHQTTYNYPYQSNEINDVTSEISLKKCSDFKYQETAQRHFELYPEQKHLDSDRDGYACDNLIRLDSNILTSAIWYELVSENIKRKQLTKNQESLSYPEVVKIIGFSHNNSIGTRRVWKDPINNMEIKILFHDQQILEMSCSKL